MFQTDLLENRVVVITGGGSGLGRAMALRAAELGAKVAITGRTEAKLQAVVSEIEEAGGTAMYQQSDVRDPAAVAAAFDAIEAAFGPLDTLVNNAAGNFLCPSEDLSYNAFDTVTQIVLYGTFNCTMDFGRRIIDDPDRTGAILNITTTYAWMGSPFVLPSACAKAGVMVMTRSLAVEWATYGIRVNAIAPGPIPTEGAFSRLMVGGLEKMALDRVPMARFGEQIELANLAMFLLSDQASYINGHTAVLDGGEWLQSGQEFAAFTHMDRGQIKQMLSAMKPKK